MSKLGECLSIRHGWAFKGEFFSETGTQSILTPGNFYEKGGFKYNDAKERFYTGDYPSEYLCKKGDLIVAMTEQAAGLLGSTAIVPENNRYLHNQRVGLITCNESKLLPLYAYYLFMTKSVREQIARSSSGTKVKHTSPEKIYEVKVRIPDTKKQYAVSEFLWRIDSKIQTNVRICAELETMAKTLYDYWFTQLDFPNAEGKPYRTSGGEMVWNDRIKRKIPKGWGAGQLSDIANITMGQSPAGESYNESGNGMIFYQGSTDFGTRFPLPRVYTSAPTRFAKAGDILMSVRAPVGTLNIALDDCCIGRGLAALNSKFGSQLYLMYTMVGFKQIFDVMDGNGTTFGSISKDTLHELKVVIPPSEQVNAFEEIVQPIEQKIRICENENRELIKLRNWLLPMLMNGQATVE